jgi:phage terminase large subunit
VTTLGAKVDKLSIPEPFSELFNPHRYKVFYGGRGSSKSWSFAIALIIKSLQGKYRILCARELQSSISDSVYHLIETQIERLGLLGYFDIRKAEITSCTGSSFIFKGIRMNPLEIKSTEGINICWVEEGQSVSEQSWGILTPTIREENSEIWVSFNPLNEEDPTYQRFVVNQQPDSYVRKVNWNDNPYFPAVLEAERLHMLRTDPDAYQHVWEGDVLRISDAVIFKGKFEVRPFETPGNVRFYHGADWGFAKDPTALVRCFVVANTLYVDQEAYGVGIDLDDTPALFDGIDTARTWPIRADNSRPETISFMRQRGYNISGAEKWHGSVEDGIAHLRSFDRIVIHERCKHTAEEFRLYSYKTDKQTSDVLPIVVDAHNHCVDGEARITTERGNVSMRDVSIGDRVMTRIGWKRVLWAGQTKEMTPVVNLVMKSGHSLIATPDHEVLTMRGFIRIDNLRGDDDVIVQNARGVMAWLTRLSTRILYSVAIQILQEEPTGFISSRVRDIGGKALTISIGKSGKMKMAPFPKAMSFIIGTVIRSITRLKISNASRAASTLKNTRLQTSERDGWLNILAESDRSQKNGTLRRKAIKNIKELARWLGLIQRSSRSDVFNAEKSMRREQCIETLNFAQTLANQHGGETTVSMTSKEFAPFAVRHTHAINTRGRKLVPSRVLCVLDGLEPRDVYDLTVEDQHEFIANGVVVHNCIDSIRYSLDGLIRKKGGVRAYRNKPVGF